MRWYIIYIYIYKRKKWWNDAYLSIAFSHESRSAKQLSEEPGLLKVLQTLFWFSTLIFISFIIILTYLFFFFKRFCLLWSSPWSGPWSGLWSGPWSGPWSGRWSGPWSGPAFVDAARNVGLWFVYAVNGLNISTMGKMISIPPKRLNYPTMGLNIPPIILRRGSVE